jgi:hypothetical protein
MTHEISANARPEGSMSDDLMDGPGLSPADALRASPVVAPYETALDGSRSPEADEWDSGQLMIANIQAADYWEYNEEEIAARAGPSVPRPRADAESSELTP